MKQWHYSENDQPMGPISETELIELFRSGRLPSNTSVWAPEFDGWVPALEVDGLVTPSLQNAASRKGAAPPTRTLADDDTFAASGEQIRPWIRYWARTIDFLLFSLLVSFVIGFIYAPAINQIPDTVFGIIILFIYLFVEPMLLSQWGTTPGKALLNIQLRNDDGSKLSYATALARSAKVVTKGQGLGLPIVSLVTLIMAYNRLTGTGITTWDESGNHSIAHGEIRAWRVIVAVLFFIGFVALIAWDTQTAFQGY